MQFDRCATRCGKVVTYHKPNDFVAHINLSVGSACHNALCATNDATKTHEAAVRNLHTSRFIDTFVGGMLASQKEDINDKGKCY